MTSTIRNGFSRRSGIPKQQEKSDLLSANKDFAFEKYRTVFPRVSLWHLNSKNKFNTKDRGVPKVPIPHQWLHLLLLLTRHWTQLMQTFVH